MAPHLQLILGGARSGKSHYALHQGDETHYSTRVFLATAMPGDEEMKRRIQRHRMERSSQKWKTVEEPYHLAMALKRHAIQEKGIVVVDCATLWISNLLCGLGGKALPPIGAVKKFEALIEVLKRQKGSVRIVSNEVGLGVVPDNDLARRFRDLQGEFNQSMAAIANQVILMTAGLPQKIK